MFINNKPHLKYYVQPAAQQGIAIIVVLVVLLLITLIGTLAVRQSNTDLKLSTSSQVEKLLFQSNDAAFMKVEKEEHLLGNKRGGAETLKGYMISPDRDGQEVNFCVRPRSERLFSVLEVSELNKYGERLNGPGTGYCDPSQSDDYVSEGRVITQMTFVKPLGSTEQTPPKVFDQEAEGTSSNDLQSPSSNGLKCTTFEGYATSILPALADVELGNASSTGTQTIAGCLKQPRQSIRPGSVTIEACLTELGVPFSTHKQIYRGQKVGTNCITQ